ncbi:hypothetical protein J2S49_000618 [Arcanobacterium wilhelmae]|uniref:DUF4241 domain-containing protein n=1 Tax=Arcanobacterium wilhelmae TaxID=1803177 RepID=A0ABT9NA02_9ACTO|nr:hypothetical protein [Arcanobacterium wilhelmae]MDP9800542.1 hypothetical protein [Arcanobacterium wilhelmae]
MPARDNGGGASGNSLRPYFISIDLKIDELPVPAAHLNPGARGADAYAVEERDRAFGCARLRLGRKDSSDAWWEAARWCATCPPDETRVPGEGVEDFRGHPVLDLPDGPVAEEHFDALSDHAGHRGFELRESFGERIAEVYLVVAPFRERIVGVVFGDRGEPEAIEFTFAHGGEVRAWTRRCVSGH